MAIAEVQTFGTPMPVEGETAPLGSAIAALSDSDAVVGKMSGRITKVCRKKGCWMVLTDGADYARVTFKDYGFFVPTDSHERDSVVYGELRKKTLSSGEANHYEKDAESNLRHTADVEEFTIVASSVEISLP